jgi:hypothetical protein
MKRRWWFLLITVFLVFIGGFLYFFRLFPPRSDDLQAGRKMWDAKGAPNYSFTVTFTWLPSVPYKSILTVRDNKFYSQAMTSPSCEFAISGPCVKAVRDPENYTIPGLFEQARQCIDRSKVAYASCNPIGAGNFHGFINFDEMYEFSRCPRLGFGDSLCHVDYSPDYGYPNRITYLHPGALDGIGGFEITDFSVDK